VLLAHATEIEFRQILRVSSGGEAECDEKAFHVPSFTFQVPETNATTPANLKLGT
jgi:hypothetical protein